MTEPAPRLVIIGMNNPISRDPRRALWTQPHNCTGNRLWRLATRYTGISESEWLTITDRRNLCIGDWDRGRACVQAHEWFDELRGQTVIWLGLDVMCAFRGPTTTLPHWTPPFHIGLQAPLQWNDTEDWFEIPHPSGLNHWYNNDGNRAAVEMRLADILWEMGYGREQYERVLLGQQQRPAGDGEGPAGCGEGDAAPDGANEQPDHDQREGGPDQADPQPAPAGEPAWGHQFSLLDRV